MSRFIEIDGLFIRISEIETIKFKLDKLNKPPYSKITNPQNNFATVNVEIFYRNNRNENIETRFDTNGDAVVFIERTKTALGIF